MSSDTPTRTDDSPLDEYMTDDDCIGDIEEKTGKRIYAPSQPDLAGIKVARGDYVEKQLAERVDTPDLVGDIATHWLRLAERRRTVVFATGVAHSVHIRDEFRRAGVWAEHIDGSTPSDERDRILQQLADGTVEVVTNCMVLTEGFDLPDLGCLVLARPTRHIGLFRQMIGRALRPAPGKDHALVLDHAGATLKHGFVEDEVVWTLDEDQRADIPAQAARGNSQAPALTTCPECSAVRLEGRPCTVCGWRPTPRPEVFDVADGELERLDRDGRQTPAQWSAAAKHSFHGQLAWICRERDYRPGWVGHKYKERFGHWPASHHAEPEEPLPETLSWVRSRTIAYAKMMEKRRGAS
jgi:superfamily II DNA or RNA helicase